MVYFIVWAVFIVGVILAVPITAMMGKPKRPKAEPADAVAAEEEQVEMTEFAEEEPAFEEQPVATEEFAAQTEVVDDFAAFDEEFK